MSSVERVKSICKEKKIPISKLERDLGYSNGYIGQLRKGVFPTDRLVDIANYLNVSTDYLLTGEEKEKPAPTNGNGLIAADMIDDGTMIRVKNPLSALAAQYCIPSDVMDMIAGAKTGSYETWKNGLGVPTKEQSQKIADFFELSDGDLEQGVFPLSPSNKVWEKLAKATEERFPNSLTALKAIQKYKADSTEENYQELISRLKDLSPDIQKKIIREILD